MWTSENGARYYRSNLRYPSDLTDAEWVLIAPLIPPAKRGGGKRSVDLRTVVSGLMYVLSTGCQWRAIPKDLPVRSTVHDYLDHPADIQDRDGGVMVMTTLFGLYPFPLKLYADGSYQGPVFQTGLRRVSRQISVEIVKRSDQAKVFAVLRKRWIVERTIGWLNRCRRLAKDLECRTRKARAFLLLASIRLMTRKLCQKTI